MVKLCKAESCKNPAGNKKSLCNKCDYDKRKKENLLLWAYGIQRCNARRRRKPFTISFEDFVEFCYETQILHGRGRTSTSFHIDCVIDELGYAKGNLQRLTNAENAQKEHERRKRRKVVFFDYLTGQGRVIDADYSIVKTDPSIPF